VRWYQGADDPFETDTQQRNDAILKALAVSYIVYNAFPGSVVEKATAFRKTPSGQALGLYYATIEVALPFSDNAAMGTGNMVDKLIAGGVAAQFDRLSALSGGRDLDGAKDMLTTLTSPLNKIVDHTRQYTDPVVAKVSPYIPGAMNAADKAAGAIANAADVMPVYRLLGARMAAEAAAYRALNP
jgi:hypothetical protein